MLVHGTGLELHPSRSCPRLCQIAAFLEPKNESGTKMTVFHKSSVEPDDDRSC